MCIRDSTYTTPVLPSRFSLRPITVESEVIVSPGSVSYTHLDVYKRQGFGNPYYQNLAKLYYALEAIGELQKLDSSIFHAIHEKGLKLIDDKSILEWVTAQGVDAKKFSDAYNSFGVVSKTKRADQMVQTSKIRGVPSLVVDGRYLVTTQNIKTHADLLALTDKVIDKARSERNQNKK